MRRRDGVEAGELRHGGLHRRDLPEVDEPGERADRAGEEGRPGAGRAEDEDEPVVEPANALRERRAAAWREALGDAELERDGFEQARHARDCRKARRGPFDGGALASAVMTRAVQVILAGLLASLLCLGGAARDAAGSARATEVQRTQLGVLGSPGRFAAQTGQRSTIQHSFIGWHQPATLPKLLHRLKPLPMVAIKTGGVVTPLGIAQGRGDGFLLELNRVLAGFGAPVYVRPMPEMNGHWNEYCAFDRSGASRGPQYSTAAFRRAFARIALIARGGPAPRPECQAPGSGAAGSPH